MTNEEKVDKLIKCYSGMHSTLTDININKMCEKVVEILTDDEFDVLYGYMSHELYPNIFEAIQTSLSVIILDSLLEATDTIQSTINDADRSGLN